MLRILAPFYFVVSAKLVADGVLRGSNLMKQFMMATFTDLILRVVLAYLLSKILGTIGIWCAWPVGWSIGTAVSLFLYRRSYKSAKSIRSTGPGFHDCTWKERRFVFGLSLVCFWGRFQAVQLPVVKFPSALGGCQPKILLDYS